MFFYLTYTITLGVWLTVGSIKFSNPNHRRFLVGGGTMVAGEQLVAWHVVKQMKAQEAAHLASRQEIRSKNTCPGWAYPILSLSNTCSLGDAPVSAFDLALALCPTPPGACTADDAPIPGTDLILAPVSQDDSPPYMPAFSVALYNHDSLLPAVISAPVSDSPPHMPAFSVALYKHDSLLPAVIPAVYAPISSQDLASFNHSISLYLACLSSLVFLFLCYFFKFGAVIAPLLKGQRTSNKDTEHSEYHVCPSRVNFSITASDMSLQGEVLIWRQSPAGCSVTVVPKFDAFKLVDSTTHDAEDTIIDIPTFQLSFESDVSQTIPLSSSTPHLLEQNNTDGIHDSDALVTVLLIETMDVDQTHKVATLDVNVTEDIPYWVSRPQYAQPVPVSHFARLQENQSFIDAFREEMNELLYPDPPVHDLYSVSDTLVTVLPPLIETLDVDQVSRRAP
ncbi:hypothetical protein C0992_007708 [Termitomyces sp. T32_za158]|nr:hypothetical protein C0992_007708 [Termitomyces sp. T32_za158]